MADSTYDPLVDAAVNTGSPVYTAESSYSIWVANSRKYHSAWLNPRLPKAGNLGDTPVNERRVSSSLHISSRYYQYSFLACGP